MPPASRARGLADLLEQLKHRSGRSYESIGRRINASKSAVHRYCTGASLPQEFGTIERIGRCCGATAEEMHELHRAWLAAVASDAGGDVPAPPADSPGGTVLEPAGVEASGGPPASSRRVYAMVAAALGITLVLALGGAATRIGMDMRNRQQRESSPGPQQQWVSGPAWVMPPIPVPRNLFGVTIQSATGTMPAFQVGAVRLWDSATRWSLLQPARGEYNWSTLDRHVDGAQRAGLPVLFVIGGTPRWASPGGAVSVYDDGARATPPDDLADWESFVRALVDRYRGRIEAYELWVLANDRRFYDGSMEKLVEMVRRGSQIIRAADPAATVVCPGMGRLWEADGQGTLKRFAELGGYNYCSVASVKLYQPKASDPPETLLQLLPDIDRMMHEAGVHRRLWNTGTNYTITSERPLDAETARNHAVRFFLTGIYGRHLRLDRMYFYAWGGTKMPIVLQADGGAPTAAALAVEQLQRWLAHAESRSCGHGLPAGLPEHVWQCDFRITGSTPTRSATIRWTSQASAYTTAGPGAHLLRRLNGASNPVSPQDSVEITSDPVLIERTTE
jgi:hypothetical protein